MALDDVGNLRRDTVEPCKRAFVKLQRSRLHSEQASGPKTQSNQDH